CRKHRFGIAHPVWLQEFQSVKEVRRYIREVEVAIDLERRLKIGEPQSGARELIEARAQLGHIRCRHRETARVRMSAIAAEQASTRFNGFEQMESADRSS